MSEAATEASLARVAGAARPGARLCYWNLLVPRSRPPALAGALASEDEHARALHRVDRGFFLTST